MEAAVEMTMRCKTAWQGLSRLLVAVVLLPFAAECAAFSKDDAAAKSATPDEPEDVLRRFLTAMLDRNEAVIRQAIVDHPEAHVLWQAEELPAFQRAIAKKSFSSLRFQRLKVGDEVQVPGRGKVVLDKEAVNDTKLQITFPGNPAVPFLLVKQPDGWKVNPAPIIAARLVAEKMKKKGQGAKRAEWSPDTKLLEKLAVEAKLDGFSIRPPTDYQHLAQDNPAGKTHVWAGTPRDDQTYPMLLVFTMRIGPEEANQKTATLMAGIVDDIKQRRSSWKASPVEEGRIGNAEFSRVRWSGICKTGREQLLGKELHGIVYMYKRGSTVLYALIEDNAPHHETTLPICEAAVLTLQPAIDPPTTIKNKSAPAK